MMTVSIPKKDAYLIIGFPKCGTTSLISYLKNKFPKATVQKSEIIYDETGIAHYKKHCMGMTPVIITRNIADKLWSAFFFFKFDKQIEFEDFLHQEDTLWQNLGWNNPIEQANHDKYIKPWLKYDPIIFDMDTLKEEDDFPRLKTSEKEKNIKIPRMPDFYRDMVNKAFKLHLEKLERFKKMKKQKPIPHAKRDRTLGKVNAVNDVKEQAKKHPQRIQQDYEKFSFT